PFTAFYLTTPHPTDTYPLSLHDALPISSRPSNSCVGATGSAVTPSASTCASAATPSIRASSSALGITSRRSVDGTSVRTQWSVRSEEHTSELQSLRHLVCRLLLEKKKTS